MNPHTLLSLIEEVGKSIAPYSPLIAALVGQRAAARASRRRPDRAKSER